MVDEERNQSETIYCKLMVEACGPQRFIQTLVL